MRGLIDDPAERRAESCMDSSTNIFLAMTAGKEFREITDKELKRTSVYAIQIEEWSGKENWKDRADQSDEWTPLGEEWFR